MFDYRKHWSETQYATVWDLIKRLGIPPNQNTWTLKKQTMAWYPSDSEQNFLEQREHHRKAWDKKHFSYGVNRYGFRCREFEDIIDNYSEENRIVFLGCSFTFGIGVDVHDTFAHKVSEKLGKVCINLSVAGAGLDTAFRIYNAWQPILKASTTIVTTPPNCRLEGLFLRADSLNVDYRDPKLRYYHGNNIIGDSDEVKVRMLSLLDPKMDIIKREQALQAINSVAAQTNSNMFVLSPYSSFEMSNFSKGRDNSHPGPDWHDYHADNIVKTVNNKTYFKSCDIDGIGTYDSGKEYSVIKGMIDAIY